MNLLLDTHFIVWLTDHPDRLTAAEKALIFDAGNVVSVSAVSIWEIRIKWQYVYRSGQRKIETPPDAVLRLVDALALPLLPLTGEVAAATLHASIPHRDPFDELLLVQAQEGGLRLLTRDELLVSHPLAWTAAA